MPQITTAVPRAEPDARTTLNDELKIMGPDFPDFAFDRTIRVSRFYDRLETRIAETGEEFEGVLVNLCGTQIDPSAWLAYSRRGKALRRIADLPGKRRARIAIDPNNSRADFARRLSFDADSGIMEADFSHLTFHHSRYVNDFFDDIEKRIQETGRRWFLLVNLNGSQMLPAACVQYALRGKRLNEGASLGAVRYAAGSETEADIRMRAETRGFRPNIRNTRSKVMERITELTAEAAHG